MPASVTLRRSRVEAELADFERPAAASPDRAAAAQDRADARHDLASAERLDDVVVGAELETDHAVGLLPARREHDDRHLGARGAARGRRRSPSRRAASRRAGPGRAGSRARLLERRRHRARPPCVSKPSRSSASASGSVMDSSSSTIRTVGLAAAISRMLGGAAAVGRSTPEATTGSPPARCTSERLLNRGRCHRGRPVVVVVAAAVAGAVVVGRRRHGRRRRRGPSGRRRASSSPPRPRPEWSSPRSSSRPRSWPRRVLRRAPRRCSADRSRARPRRTGRRCPRRRCGAPAPPVGHLDAGAARVVRVLGLVTRARDVPPFPPTRSSVVVVRSSVVFVRSSVVFVRSSVVTVTSSAVVVPAARRARAVHRRDHDRGEHSHEHDRQQSCDCLLHSRLPFVRLRGTRMREGPSATRPGAGKELVRAHGRFGAGSYAAAGSANAATATKCVTAATTTSTWKTSW